MAAENDLISVALGRMEDEMRRIASGESDAYEAGWRIWEQALSLAPESPDLMWPFWLVWGALTDWPEQKPDEALQAHEAMRRAAREWLTLNDDSSAREAYFEKWVYQELGYDRPAGGAS